MKRTHFGSLDSTNCITSTSDGNIFEALIKDGALTNYTPFNAQNQLLNDYSQLEEEDQVGKSQDYERIQMEDGHFEYKCPFCIKTFKKKSKLDRHKVQHTKEVFHRVAIAFIDLETIQVSISRLLQSLQSKGSFNETPLYV